MGPRLPVAPQRHVRFCDSRPRPRLPVPRARPVGGEAAPLHLPVGRLDRLCVRTQGLAAPPAVAAGGESVGGRGERKSVVKGNRVAGCEEVGGSLNRKKKKEKIT